MQGDASTHSPARFLDRPRSGSAGPILTAQRGPRLGKSPGLRNWTRPVVPGFNPRCPSPKRTSAVLIAQRHPSNKGFHGLEALRETTPAHPAHRFIHVHGQPHVRRRRSNVKGSTRSLPPKPLGRHLHDNAPARDHLDPRNDVRQLQCSGGQTPPP